MSNWNWLLSRAGEFFLRWVPSSPVQRLRGEEVKVQSIEGSWSGGAGEDKGLVASGKDISLGKVRAGRAA